VQSISSGQDQYLSPIAIQEHQADGGSSASCCDLPSRIASNLLIFIRQLGKKLLDFESGQ
jgi:hypothetical protein